MTGLVTIIVVGAIALGSPTVNAGVESPIIMDWVVVGDPGNPPDSSTSDVGDVAYTFRIGRYEVTNAQYAAFLNAKAATSNALGLYNTSMSTDARGGISRAGGGTIADPWVYDPRPNMANKPVNFVGWYDCVRFINWLHNGQGDRDTESGAYTLLGGTPVPTNPAAIVRDPAARYWLPNNDEWHKAALYEPGASGNHYWAYATRTDTTPTIASATPAGDIANPGPNVVNYIRGADWAGQDGHVTTVGSAGSQSASHYGTYDQNGNVFEWCEDLIGPSMRARRGGSWVEDWFVFFGGGFGSATPTIEIFSFGLRVAAALDPADLNADGHVNGLDLAILLGQWTGQQTIKPCPPSPPADLNHDCRVNGLDIAVLLGAWG